MTADIGVELISLSSVEAYERDGKNQNYRGGRGETRVIASRSADSGRAGSVRLFDHRLVRDVGTGEHGARIWSEKFTPTLSKVLESQQSREFFQTNSFECVDLTPDQFAQLARNDFTHWGALIKATGVKLD